MSFDTIKDITLATIGTITSGSGSDWSILVEIKSYDGGDPKLSLVRCKENDDDGEMRFRALGRLSSEETDGLRDIFLRKEFNGCFDRATKVLKKDTKAPKKEKDTKAPKKDTKVPKKEKDTKVPKKETSDNVIFCYKVREDKVDFPTLFGVDKKPEQEGLTTKILRNAGFDWDPDITVSKGVKGAWYCDPEDWAGAQVALKESGFTLKARKVT